MISVAIASRNRPMELAAVLGSFSQRSDQVSEVVVVDNSDLPYLDNPIFILLQETYAHCGMDLIFVRHPKRETVATLKFYAVNHCSCPYVLVWDDDSILATHLNMGLPDVYALKSWCFMDAVNYLGYSDREEWTNPEDMPSIIHPITVQYRWFQSLTYDRIETPWGGNGIFMVAREPWLDFFNKEGGELLDGMGHNYVSGEVILNAAYCAWLGKPAVIYFRDRLVNMYHPTQSREWDLSKFDETSDFLKREYIKDGAAYFVGSESNSKLWIG